MTVGFLIGCACGFFCGLTVGAIFAVGASTQETDGNATIESRWPTEGSTGRVICRYSVVGATKPRPNLTLVKNPQPINPASDILA